MKRPGIKILALIGFVIFLLSLSPQESRGANPNWSAIPSTDMILIYPGVASWEFLLSDDHRLGGRAIKRKQKKDCKHCHLSRAGELDMKVDEIAAGTANMKRSHKPFEPKPIPGKPGTLHANVKAAYDKEYIYLRVEWKSKGTGWSGNGAGKKTPDRISLQINKRNTSFKKYGCFISCHNDLNTMPDSPSKRRVLSNPYYQALKRDDVRLYAFYTRSSWSNRRSEAELKKARADGGLIDLWSLELTGSKVTSHDGWIFDDRRWEGTSDVQGSGSWAEDKYTVTFKRRLRTKSAYDISLKEGDVVSMGMAIHDGGVKKRRHYVSFAFTVGLGENADIKARKIAE
jgi:cytochrome c-type protein NapC